MVIETLEAYGRKQVGADAVMRQLVQHDGWFMPATYAVTALNRQTFDKMSMFGAETRLPPGEIWFFTDHASAQRAADQGAKLGPFVSPIAGWEVFGTLPEQKAGFAAVKVNPGSPQSQQWFISAGGFELAKLWAKAVKVEKMLAGTVKGQLIDELLDFEGYQAFVTGSTGAIATAVGSAGMKNPGMVFTAPDCADELLRKVGSDAAKNLKRVTLGGAELFSKFDALGIDGLIFNIGGPVNPKPLSQDICRAIAESKKDRDEVRRLEALANQES